MVVVDLVWTIGTFLVAKIVKVRIWLGIHLKASRVVSKLLDVVLQNVRIPFVSDLLILNQIEPFLYCLDQDGLVLVFGKGEGLLDDEISETVADKGVKSC